jgi:hypothetical protein
LAPPTPTINVTITNTIASPATPPITLNFTLGVTGIPINEDNETITLVITAGASNTAIGTHSIAVVTAQASYSIVMDYLYLGGESPMPTSNYLFTVNVKAFNNLIAPGSLGNPSSPVTNTTNTSVATVVVDNPSVSITSTIPVYDTLPIQVNFQTSFDPANSGIAANAANLTVVFTFAYTVTGGELINMTLPYNASGGYAVTIDATSLATLNYNNGVYATGHSSDSYAITAFITAANSSKASFPTRTVQAQDVILFTTNTPTVSIVSPTNSTTGLYVGTNVSIAVGYAGDFVTGANVTVTPAAGGAAVYTQGIFSPGHGAHAASVNWVPGATGKYTVTATILTPYGTFTSQNNNVSVAANPNTGNGGGGALTYVNTTNWHNASLLGGLSPGVASAVLLVVGLIIGMIVALALGRAMWGALSPSRGPASGGP